LFVRLEEDFVAGDLVAADAAFFVDDIETDVGGERDIAIFGLEQFDGMDSGVDLPAKDSRERGQRQHGQQEHAPENSVELAEIHGVVPQNKAGMQ
jgi:hypothetical protein